MNHLLCVCEQRLSDGAESQFRFLENSGDVETLGIVIKTEYEANYRLDD